MKQKMFAFSVIISMALLAATGTVVIAQEGNPPEDRPPEISGYFVNINMQESGPYDMAGLLRLINQGQLARNSLVWKTGMATWALAGTIEELAPLFDSMTPPPLPPSARQETQTRTRRTEPGMDPDKVNFGISLNPLSFLMYSGVLCLDWTKGSFNFQFLARSPGMLGISPVMCHII